MPRIEPENLFFLKKIFPNESDTCARVDTVGLGELLCPVKLEYSRTRCLLKGSQWLCSLFICTFITFKTSKQFSFVI